MSQFPEFKYFVQPALFEYGETITGKLELLPQMWYVAEALASPSSANRRAALEFIYEQQVAKFSPLISYLLMTRIDEPDINMRQDIIRLLADVLQPDNDGITATDQVRIVLYEYFSQLDHNKILSILKTAETYPLLEPQVEVLLGASANWVRVQTQGIISHKYYWIENNHWKSVSWQQNILDEWDFWMQNQL
jgi:hypothetical protein